MPYLSLVPHQSAHSFVRVVLKNTPFITNGMSSMQIGFVQALLSKGNSRMSKKGLAGFVTFSTGLETASAAAPDPGKSLVPLLADDVVASVRRMYAEDYSLVKRLARFDLDELLANATTN